jgi:hypothetical protein
MIKPSSEPLACDYCGLPLPHSLWETPSKTDGGPQYCGVGCRFAAASGVRPDNLDPVAGRCFAFAGFFALNVMIFTLVQRFADDRAPAEETRFSETASRALRYLTMVVPCFDPCLTEMRAQKGELSLKRIAEMILTAEEAMQ